MLEGLVVNAKISVVKISQLFVVKHFSSREKAPGLDTIYKDKKADNQ